MLKRGRPADVRRNASAAEWVISLIHLAYELALGICDQAGRVPCFAAHCEIGLAFLRSLVECLCFNTWLWIEAPPFCDLN